MFRIVWVLLVSFLPSRIETQPSIPPAHCKQVCSELQLTPATAICSIFNPRTEKPQLRFCYQGAETGKIVGCSHCCSTTKFDWLLDSGQLVRSRIASCGNSNTVLQRACEAGFNSIVSEIMATLEERIARSQSDTPQASDSVVEVAVDVSGTAIEQREDATEPYPMKGGVTTPRVAQSESELDSSRHTESALPSSSSREKAKVGAQTDSQQSGQRPLPSDDGATAPSESRRLELEAPTSLGSSTVLASEMAISVPQEPAREVIAEVHVSTVTNNLSGNDGAAATENTTGVQEVQASTPEQPMTPAPDSSKIISFLSRAPSGLHIRGAFHAGQSLNDFADDWCSAAGFADVREACSLVTKERIMGAIKAGRWEDDVADDVSLFIPIRLRSRRLTLLTRGNETVRHAVKRMCGQLYPSSKGDEEACEQAQMPVARSLIQTHFGSKFHPSLL